MAKYVFLMLSFMISGVVVAQSADERRRAAYKAKMERLYDIEGRAKEVRPYRREEPVRGENIRDREVQEIQLATSQVMPGAIVNIGAVVTGCPCEDGPSCSDQVWIVAYRPERSMGFLLSRISGHWTIGPVQKWWWDYQDLLARRGTFSKGWEELMDRFPACADEAGLPKISGNAARVVRLAGPAQRGY